MDAVDRLVEPVEKAHALFRDSRRHQTAICRVPPTSDQPHTLEAIEQTRHVGHLGNEPRANIGAAKTAFPRSAQDPKNVVLRTRDAVGLQRFGEVVAEYGRGTGDPEKSFLLEAGEALPLFDLVLQLPGHALKYVLSHIICKVAK